MPDNRVDGASRLTMFAPLLTTVAADAPHALYAPGTIYQPVGISNESTPDSD
jgi:hypothetical protein